MIILYNIHYQTNMGNYINNKIISESIRFTKDMVIYGDSIYDSLFILNYMNLDLYKSRFYIYTNKRDNYFNYPDKVFVEENNLDKLEHNSFLIVDHDDLCITNTTADRVIYVLNNFNSEFEKKFNLHIKSYSGKFYCYYMNELVDLVHHSDYDDFLKIYDFLLKINT